MSVKTVQATINGQTYTLTFNSSTGKYEATVTAPSKSSYNQSGHYYGVTVKATDEAGNTTTKDATDSTLGSSLQLKVKEKIKDAVLMFVTAPDAGTLRDRLVGRGTETPEVIAARLARACEESEGIENYDYLVVNDTVDHASALIDQLICDEQSQNTGRDQEYRVSANIDFINQMRENLKSFSKGE